MFDNSFSKFILLVRLHHEENPTHGYNCACLDAYIGELRRATKVPNKEVQRRIDYVLLAALRRY